MLVKNFGYYIYEAFQLTESYLMKQKHGKQRLLLVTFN